MIRAAAVALSAATTAVMIFAAACGGPIFDAAPATTRPPLTDPPDPGPAPAKHGLSAAAVASLGESTFRVFGIACGHMSEGSGFAVSDEVVVTNAHVLLGVDEPMLEAGDGRRIAAAVVAFDEINDIALLRVEGAGFAPLPLGDADDGTVGALFGWEQGPELDVTPFRVDRPVTVKIEAVGRDDRIARPSYLLAADVESGDSGAPLIDESGTVVGVAYMSTTRDASVGYAVRTEPIRTLIDRGFNDNVVVPDCATTRSGGNGSDAP